MGNYLITGANSEIGKELAIQLVHNNHKVILVSRSSKDNTLSKKVPWLDGIDLTDESDLEKLKEFTEAEFKTPFAFIHSVGDFWKHKSITDTSFGEVQSLINSHYITLFGAIKAVVPIMQKIGGGKIFAFSCNSVKYNYPDMAAFTSAKAAVECLLKCVANEQSKYNITANIFALPSIKTNSVVATKPEEFHKDYATLEELTTVIEQISESVTPLMNGTTINLFKYSRSFYHKGYYERNIIWEASNED